MKNKIKSILGSAGAVLFIVVSLAIYNWSYRRDAREHWERIVEERMEMHNHIYFNDLLVMQRHTLTEIQNKLEIKSNKGAPNAWNFQGATYSTSGYKRNDWYSSSPETEKDKYGCFNFLMGMDVKGSTLLLYRTNDAVYREEAQSSIESNANFKIDKNVKDEAGNLCKFYINEVENIGLITFSGKKTSDDEKKSYAYILGSLDNYKSVMNQTLTFD